MRDFCDEHPNDGKYPPPTPITEPTAEETKSSGEPRSPLGLVALWRNDLFPYASGGPVLRVHEGGLVETIGYGGYRFVPLVLLPEAEGLAVLAGLAALTQQERDARVTALEAWTDKADALLAEHGVSRHR